MHYLKNTSAMYIANHCTSCYKTFYPPLFLPITCRGYQQQDAHEFMRYLLDKLHTELAQALQTRTSEQAKNTIVSDIFGGVLQSDVSCQLASWLGKGSLVPVSLLTLYHVPSATHRPSFLGAARSHVVEAG